MKSSILDRARKYISRISATSGQGGHADTFSAAVALVKGFALPEPEALAVLAEWNAANASPPWSEANLRYKIKSAAKANQQVGYLLGERDRNPLAGTGSFRSKARPPASMDDEKAAHRKRWSTIRQLNDGQRQEIASLRHVPIEAVTILDNAGFLGWAPVDGELCFIIREGEFAQARRFDGGLLPTSGGPKKTKNLPGSQGKFLGAGWLGGPGLTGGPPPVLLVEGAVGLLEATTAAWLTGADCQGWTILGATSASSRFDDAWLARLAGRRVRIVPDADESGYEAAASWLTSLESAGCQVDAIRLPDGVKDLGPLVAEPEKYSDAITAIFQ